MQPKPSGRAEFTASSLWFDLLCSYTEKKKVEGEGEPNQTGLSECQDVAHVDFFIFGKNLSVRLQNG